ncbi:restriction endonuclease subunit S [Specibacter sp. NPDC078709]|uniref:restriction endonuclease subunit S n=1 Tax=Specibacter sp. NPDC078709 TaxID=3154364 RepID=UPI003434CA3E
MNDWTRLPLVEALAFREGPGVLAKDFHDAGVPLIRLAGLKNGASLLEGCNFLDPDLVAVKWNHFRLELGDVLLSTSASLGEVSTVDDSGVGAIPYTGIIGFRPNDDRILPQFIPFLLTAPTFKAQIEAMGVGSVMKHFGPSHLKHMTVDIPPIRDQQAIAEVLGTLDDKIAANTKLAATAEELSHSLFRSMLDKDARSEPLSGTAQFVNGKAFTKNATGTGRVVIRIAELNSGIGGSTVYNDIEVDEKYLAVPGSILFAWSGSLTLHRWHRSEGIVNQHIFKVIPSAGYPDWLVFELLRKKLDEFKSIASDKATTMGHIQRKHLDEPVLVPSSATITERGPLMQSLWQQSLNASMENETLAATRDALLPQLMSGKLRVRDAESAVLTLV